MSSLSIVCVTLNAAERLPPLLATVRQLLIARPSYEFILQDGCSSDNTVALARSTLAGLQNFRLYVGKDGGIYDAMNTALSRARCKYTLFVGSDDALLPYIASSDFFEALASGADYLVSPVIFFGPRRNVVRYWSTRQNISFPLSLFHSPYPPHTGFVCATSLARSVAFDSRYSVSADFLHILTITRNPTCSSFRLLSPCVAMAIGGVSTSPAGIAKGGFQIREINSVLGVAEPLFVRYARNVLQYLRGMLYGPILLSHSSKSKSFCCLSLSSLAGLWAS
jgi:glycosyltransferase involved in cell wall biosynthesis